MQTGDRAGFGDQPKAAARRLLSRALWVGGLAVAATAFGAASANATEAERAEEPSPGLLGSVTSAVEPVTGLAGSLADDTDELLAEDLALTGDLLGVDSVPGDVEVAGLVDRPIDEPEDVAASRKTEQKDSDALELADERDAAIDAHTDRRMRREPVEDADERDADTGEPGPDGVAERGLVSLIGAVDRVFATSGAVPELAEVANATGVADVAVGGLVTLLDAPLTGDASMLAPLEPLRDALGPVVGAAAPPTAYAGALAGQVREETKVPAPSERAAVDRTPNMSADSAPRSSFDETGAARPAGQDGESAVIHSSLDAGANGQDPFSGTREGLRPSLLVTPVAGLSVLHVGAPGAATSADQAGPSSHALLPEEAVLRARLFSAAAYARSVAAKPQREANDPPVSPD